MLTTAQAITPAAVNAPPNAFVVGRRRWWRASDIRRHTLLGDDNGVTYIVIHGTDGSDVGFAYTSFTVAEEDYRRIEEGGTQVVMRGDSSFGAPERAAAIIRVIGREWNALDVRRGRR